jgi:hypothetical protein
MKSLIQVCLVLLLAVSYVTNIDAQENEMKPGDIAWTSAKSAYHKVMAGTFHPAEEGDLEPLKKQHNVLAWQASNWLSYPIPKNLRTKEMKKNLKMLKFESNEISKLVMKGASDEQLTKAMFELHDIFHAIVGLCNHEEVHM